MKWNPVIPTTTVLIKEPPLTGSGSEDTSVFISLHLMLICRPLPEQRSVSKGASSAPAQSTILKSFVKFNRSEHRICLHLGVLCEDRFCGYANAMMNKNANAKSENQ
jgi:hypothetical protein